MKTAISVPDEIFARVNQFARRRRMSRSSVFTAAVEEYVHKHSGEDVTQRLDAIYGVEDSTLDPVLGRLQMASIPKEIW